MRYYYRKGRMLRSTKNRGRYLSRAKRRVAMIVLIIGGGLFAQAWTSVSNSGVPAQGAPTPITATNARFEICASVRETCVVDGDTFWLAGTKVRIADIDTPEISSPKCRAEKLLGEKAKHRLRELLNAGPFELASLGSRDEDRYGRKLRVVLRDGRSIGDQLVSEGLARTWTGRRQPWC